MTNTDTYKLLRECNSGIQMGVSRIADVLSAVSDKNMKSALIDSRDKHEKLGNETHAILNEVGDTTKEPNPMAKGMSWLKTNVKLTFDSSDNTVADLITEGCNMGVKSLNKYLNQYEKADEKVKDITRRLIDLETKLAMDMRAYL